MMRIVTGGGRAMAPRVPIMGRGYGTVAVPDFDPAELPGGPGGPPGGGLGGPPAPPPLAPQMRAIAKDGLDALRDADLAWRRMEQQMRELRPEHGMAISVPFVSDDEERRRGKRDLHVEGDGTGDLKETQKDPITPKDVVMALTGAKNDKELTDIEHHKKTFDPGDMSKRLDEMEKKLAGLHAEGKLSDEMTKLYETYRDTGAMKINLSPTMTSHAYVNILRSDVGAERAQLMASATKEPRAVFGNAISYGAQETKTGRADESTLALGPRGADVVVSRETAGPGGSAYVHNQTTAQHALVGHVQYGAHADVAAGRVTQMIVGTGEGHSPLTGQANLSSQKELFGGLMKRSLGVMEQMGRDNALGVAHDPQQLRAIAERTPKTLGERWVDTKMYASGLYQAVSGAPERALGQSVFGYQPAVPEPLDLTKHPELAVKALNEANPAHAPAHSLQPNELTQPGSPNAPRMPASDVARAVEVMHQAQPAQTRTNTRGIGIGGVAE